MAVRLLALIGALVGNTAFAADVMWMTEDAQAKRFVGEEVVGPFFAMGTRLEVLTREGEWVRVRKAADYGWVESKLLSEEEPIAPPADVPIVPPAEE
jgi:hypothetical protein